MRVFSTPHCELPGFISSREFAARSGEFECLAHIRGSVANGTRKIGLVAYVLYTGCDREVWPAGLYRLHLVSE